MNWTLVASQVDRVIVTFKTERRSKRLKDAFHALGVTGRVEEERGRKNTERGIGGRGRYASKCKVHITTTFLPTVIRQYVNLGFAQNYFTRQKCKCKSKLCCWLVMQLLVMQTTSLRAGYNPADPWQILSSFPSQYAEIQSRHDRQASVSTMFCWANSTQGKNV